MAHPDKFNEPLIIVSPDPQMIIGFEEFCTNLWLICSQMCATVEYLESRGVAVFCGERDGQSNASSSRALLLDNNLQKFLTAIKKDTVYCAFFKLNFDSSNYPESLPFTNVHILNNSFKLSNRYENKTKLIHEIDPKLLGKFKIAKVAEIKYSDLMEIADETVIQSALGWAGNTTWFIKSENDWDSLKPTLPSNQLIKINPRYKGVTYTLNGCIAKSNFWISDPFIQITGIEYLTPYQGGTVGNVFGNHLIESSIRNSVKSIGEKVAKSLQSENYRGIFGIDVIIEDHTQAAILIEVNARMTASVSMMSQMQLRRGMVPIGLMHLLSFNNNYQLAEEENNLVGCQLVRRLNNDRESPNKNQLDGTYNWNDNQKINDSLGLKDLREHEYIVLTHPTSLDKGKELWRLQLLDNNLVLTDNQLINHSMEVLAQRIDRRMGLI